MKKFLAAALALSAIACQQKEDTIAAGLWPRTFQPRLNVATGWQPCRPQRAGGERVVQNFSCGAPHNGPGDVSPLSEACDDMNETTHEQALEELSSPSPCYGKAIRNLERLAKQDERFHSDVAAAYYVRAQRRDDPSDLLPAMQHAQEAVNHSPRSSVARFNLALVQEALGLDADAIESWDLVRAANDGPWSTEAGEHREALAARVSNYALVQWPLTKTKLNTVDPGDRATVASLIEPHPLAAQRFVEEELLPAWDLPRARAIAEALWKRNGDRYVLDVVEAAEKSGGALRGAHEEFAKARLWQYAMEFKSARRRYERTAISLKAAQSPLYLGSQVGAAVALAVDWKGAEARAILADVERHAAARGYKQLTGQAWSTEALIESYTSSVASADSYEKTRQWFGSIADLSGVAEAHRGRTGALRYSGEREQAWRESTRARRLSSSVAELHPWHHIYGESSDTAAEMGYPRVALAYSQRVIERIRAALVAAPPEQPERLLHLRRNLSVALRKRATYEAQLEQTDAAQRDVAESLRLAVWTSDARDRAAYNAFVARAQEVAGQVALARRDPQAAVAAFTQAIELGTDEYTTFVAGLYAQRAEAHRQLRNLPAAEADLEAALAQLHAEETRMLESRVPGRGEPLLSAYFSRFQQTYDRLIRHYIETDRPREAFELAERARAIEPLDLLLRQTKTIPEQFARLARRRVDLKSIQRQLPANTYLLQYSIQDDRAYVWMIGRGEFKALTLDVRRENVEAWAEQLYRDAREPARYDRLASEVHQKLVQQALALVPPTPDRRVVFVPDGPLHRIPIAALRNGSEYLIQQLRIAFAGSARLYVWSVELDRAMAHGAPSILLVGNPTGDLAYAAAEVAEIAPLYQVSRTLIGAQATTAAFLADAPEYSVVHIAAHAVANAETPSQSHLRLAGNSTLEAQDLVQKLSTTKTRLFVLSACSSAGGTPVGPEGVAPLVRPLIAAGVPAVVGSLWTVNDPAARRLMVPFHRYLGAGHDAADALRLAQIDLLGGTAGERSVLTWGSFQVIGHATSPFASPPKSIKEK